jgi:hypothetical protein
VTAPGVGDVIATVEELDALPEGCIVLTDDGEIGQKWGEKWDFPGYLPSSAEQLASGSATILYLPGHPPRPERVVKAEALREAATAWPTLLRDMVSRGHVAKWLDERADHIEQA